MVVPAVIVGADINGLGVARSLARERVPTWLVESDPSDPALRTRHSGKHIVGALGGTTVVDALIGLRRRFADDPVLFLTREETVETVLTGRERIAGLYRFSLPQAAVMQPLLDKVGFQQLAEAHGFPVPRAVSLGDGTSLAAAEGLRFPCVVKPVRKTPEYIARCKKAYKVEDRAQLRRVLDEVAGAAEMIAQEWIEGGDDRIHFCLQYRPRAAAAAVSFTGRKLRSWPPRVGGTASCVPAPEAAAELAALTDAFFAATGFFGLGSMEFKQDAASGRFLMIEPTVGRTDFQEEIATLNGVNIPYAAYCGELGRELPEARRRRGAAWAVAPIDRWSREQQPNDAARSPRGLRRYDAMWRLDDPLPWCVMTAGRVKARLAAWKPRRR
jgi:predicted ATP-grasp superfamily ATP-dependent carboligase